MPISSSQCVMVLFRPNVRHPRQQKQNFNKLFFFSSRGLIITRVSNCQHYQCPFPGISDTQKAISRMLLMLSNMANHRSKQPSCIMFQGKHSKDD